MSPYLHQLAAAVQATEIRSSTSFAWFGRPLRPLPSRIRAILSPAARRSYFVFQLQQRLYDSFYCRGYAAPIDPAQDRPESWAGSEPFVSALSEANCGSGSWESCWKVRQDEEGSLAVERGGLTLWVRTGEYRGHHGQELAPGVQVDLRLPKELLRVSPGFYMALGDRAFAELDRRGLVRVYWNSTPEGAIRLMRSVTTALNGALFPFKLKSLSNPRAFLRCDSVVLYVRGSDFHEVASILSGIYRDVASCLRHGVPALTKSLAPGVGFAEDPPDGRGFGMSRCGLVAEGLLEARETSLERTQDRLQSVERTFREHGVSLEEPFLNPGSRGTYEFPRGARLAGAARANIAAGQTGEPPELLRTALSIGRRLCSEAIWAGDRCNWVGPTVKSEDHVDSESPSPFAALGPDIYSGTSGIALFLAELHRQATDASVRNTALGAIRQALSHVDVLLPSTAPGFYRGWTGVAFSAARIGSILGEEFLLREAESLVRRFVRTRLGQHPFDLIYGCAGAIPALLILGETLGSRVSLDLAVRMGDQLLRAARRGKAGYSWESATAPDHRTRTGLSHGAAGAGYALLELFHATGRCKYRDAALEAFRFERRWFNPEEANWSDSRWGRRRSNGEGASGSFGTTWCHGAPGIALSRIRAYEITGEQLLRAEAEIALETTRRALEADLLQGTARYSLCHGLTGNADVLLYGREGLGSVNSLQGDLPVQVGEAMMEMCRDDHPSGREPIRAESSPGLMLGLAGIGYYCLRLGQPGTPSLLILRRESFLTSRSGRSSPPATRRSGV